MKQLPDQPFGKMPTYMELFEQNELLKKQLARALEEVAAQRIELNQMKGDQDDGR